MPSIFFKVLQFIKIKWNVNLISCMESFEKRKFFQKHHKNVNTVSEILSVGR